MDGALQAGGAELASFLGGMHWRMQGRSRCGWSEKDSRGGVALDWWALLPVVLDADDTPAAIM